VSEWSSNVWWSDFGPKKNGGPTEGAPPRAGCLPAQKHNHPAAPTPPPPAPPGTATHNTARRARPEPPTPNMRPERDRATNEAEKAAESARRAAAEEAEKKALLDHLSKPSGVSDEVRMQRAAAIIQRAVNNGQTEVFVGKFPNTLCTDRGRAINQAEPGWEKTLTGLPKELYEFWDKHLRPRGYKLRCQI